MNGMLGKHNLINGSEILGKPRFGWCTFRLCSFSGRLSNIEDVPDILLNGIECYMKNDVAAFSFNEEGSEFHVLITPTKTYVISIREKQELLKFDINGYEVILQMLDDIEENIREWASFGAGSPYEDEYRKTRQENEDKLIVMTQHIRFLEEKRKKQHEDTSDI